MATSRVAAMYDFCEGEINSMHTESVSYGDNHADQGGSHASDAVFSVTENKFGSQGNFLQ